jgi:hypothetical protein
MIYRSCVAALAILAISAIQARSAYVLDIGSNSCEKWVEARKVRGAIPEVMHTSWIYGYLSSAAALLEGEAGAAVLLGKNNQTLIEKADILNPKYIDANAINAWFDNYCLAHPLERLADAITVLLIALKEKTGYLREAVCETSDLQQEGREGCVKALEATKRAVTSTLEDVGQASPTDALRRSKPVPPSSPPQARPAAGPPQTHQGQFIAVVPPGGPGRNAGAANRQ